MATRAQAIAEAEKGRSRSAVPGGDTKKNAFDKKAGRVSSKVGRVGADSKSDMESDVYYAFAFTGFPGDTDEVEAVNLMKEYANDFLGDFNVQVVGSNAAKGQIALTFLASEGEALAANVHAQRDKFVYRGHTLSTVAIDTLEIAAFKFPEAHPVVSPLPEALPGASHAAPPGSGVPRAPAAPPGPSPIHASPNRRVVQRVLEQVVPPGLPPVPVLPPGDAFQTTVLASLGQISEFMTTQLVTRAHLEAYHQEQLNVITNRVKQAVEPIHAELQVLRARVEVLESARHRSVSEQPRATDPAFKRIVFKQLPVALLAQGSSR